MANTGVDIDEVLSETAASYLIFHNNKYKTSYTLDDLSSYSFNEMLGVSREQEKVNILSFFESEYALSADAVDGSIEAIKELGNHHKLFAVTSRPKQLEELTLRWLGEHYDNAFHEVIFTGSDLQNSTTKASVCLDKQLDCIIEDQLKFANDCAGACGLVLLLDKPWNQAEAVANNIKRVFSWKEITTELSTFA